MGMVRLAERIPRGSLTPTLTLGEKSDVAIANGDVVPYTEFPPIRKFCLEGLIMSDGRVISRSAYALICPLSTGPDPLSFDRRYTATIMTMCYHSE